MASARKVPSFGYLTDDRKRHEPLSVNPMIYFSLNGIFTDLSSLSEWGEKFTARFRTK